MELPQEVDEARSLNDSHISIRSISRSILHGTCIRVTQMPTILFYRTKHLQRAAWENIQKNAFHTVIDPIRTHDLHMNKSMIRGNYSKKLGPSPLSWTYPQRNRPEHLSQPSPIKQSTFPYLFQRVMRPPDLKHNRPELGLPFQPVNPRRQAKMYLFVF